MAIFCICHVCTRTHRRRKTHTHTHTDTPAGRHTLPLHWEWVNSVFPNSAVLSLVWLGRLFVCFFVFLHWVCALETWSFYNCVRVFTCILARQQSNSWVRGNYLFFPPLSRWEMALLLRLTHTQTHTHTYWNTCCLVHIQTHLNTHTCATWIAHTHAEEPANVHKLKHALLKEHKQTHTHSRRQPWQKMH